VASPEGHYGTGGISQSNPLTGFGLLGSHPSEPDYRLPWRGLS
jgi:hypothetical protein